MIIGVGTDIIEIKRVERSCENPSFLEKYYTEREQELVRQRKSRAASNFAVKEAVSKVLGTGFRGFGAKDIEVLRNDLGAPYVVLYGGALELSKQLGIENIHVSISDTKDCVVAFAVGEGAAE